ncbi:MAG: outer membrane beta-barrel family protein [Bacteroidales bacterium]
MRRNILLIVFIISALHLAGISQPSASGQDQPKGGLITGTIIEKRTENPMEFVNVILYSAEDSIMVTGSISDAEGKFEISPVKPGKYYLKLNFIGFRKRLISDVQITREDRVADMGRIALTSSSKDLEGVEVSAEEQRVEYKIDRKIINVSQDLSSSGGTAVDALENTPSVEVDIEGNVSLRGSSSFTVLIDGKPTSLDGNDILKQIPASSIQRIEIITNPSVRYDPEGGSGIINIVLKKRQRTGFNGIVNASAGNHDTYSGDFLLNYRQEKTNWYIGADYSERNYPGDAVMFRETYGDTTFYVDSERERVWKRGRMSARAGLDYYFTDKQTLSFTTRAGEYTYGHELESETKSYTDPQTQTQYTLDESLFDITGQYFEFTSNYDYQLDGNGHKLEASAVYSQHDRDETDGQETYITNEDYQPLNSAQNSIWTSEDQISHRLRVNVDYTRPLNNTSNIETGFQSRLRSEEIDYQLDTPVSGSLSSEYFTSRRLDAYQDVHSIYAVYAKELNLFSFKAGLRGEYTDRNITNPDSAETYGYKRFDIFPSLHISKELNDKNKLMASYSRRINRPRSWYLDPFLSYRDQYTLRKGNPDLKPEHSDSYELTYLRYFSKGFISFESFFRQTNNRIERVAQLYDKDILMMTFQNVDKDQSMGSELMANIKFTKWLRLNASGSAYHFRIFSEKNGEQDLREDMNWRIRGNTDIDITKTTRIQLSAFYSGPSITSTGTRGDHFMTSMALRQDFFNDQLNLVFRIRDIFSTRGHESTTEDENYYVFMEHISPGPRVSLSVTYKINNFKRKPRTKDEADDGVDMGF